MTNLLYNAHRNLTRQDLVDYINSHYKAPRMVLAAAGGRCSSSYAVRTHCGALHFLESLDAYLVCFLYRCEPRRAGWFGQVSLQWSVF